MQVHDFVVQIFQSYCDAYFHWYIEIFPRIAPFLDALLVDDAPRVTIHIGCDIQPWHIQFFELVGMDVSKFCFIGSEPIFAKEVGARHIFHTSSIKFVTSTTSHSKILIKVLGLLLSSVVPTPGYSHSPYLNYWNILYLRQRVEQRIGAAGPVSTGTRKILIIVRDKGRRGDTSFFYDSFFQRLYRGLNGTHDIDLFASSNNTLMSCLECQVRVFQSADVIIGSHGAGLSHLVFAKKGATLIERLETNSDSGIYSELAYMVGLKYFPIGKFAHVDAYVDIIRFAECTIR